MMKSKGFRAAIAAVIALAMILSPLTAFRLTASALSDPALSASELREDAPGAKSEPRTAPAEEKTAPGAEKTAPDGFNENDYAAVAAFLEQQDENGVSNAEKLELADKLDDPALWYPLICFNYAENGENTLTDEYRLLQISASDMGLCGELILDGCEYLNALNCANNELTRISLDGCAALTLVNSGGNKTTEMRLPDSERFPGTYARAAGGGYVSLDVWTNNMTTYNRAAQAEEIIPGSFIGWFNADTNSMISTELFIELQNEETDLEARFRGEPNYDPHDLEKLRAFLEQMDENGVKNGEKLNAGYDPNDVSTWNTSINSEESWSHFAIWTGDEDSYHLKSVNLSRYTEQWQLIKLHGVLDLSGCTMLTKVEGYDQPIVSIDLSDCPRLETVSLFSCGVRSIALGGCEMLSSLDVTDGALGELDVSGCPNLTALSCNGNSIERIVFADTEELPMQSLVCSENEITQLDTSRMPSLEYFSCGDNPIESLELSNCPNLTNLDCSRCLLTRLDLSRHYRIDAVHCEENNISELLFRETALLMYLDCSGNPLTELKLPYCAENPEDEFGYVHVLTNLDCSNCLLTKLDVTMQPELYHLNCSGNRITELLLSATDKLHALDVSGNHLTSLDLSPFINLYELKTFGNPLEAIVMNSQSWALREAAARCSEQGEQPGGTVSFDYGYHVDSETGDFWEVYSAYAQTIPGSEFLGWYNGADELLSAEPELELWGREETEVYAVFTPGASQVPGDVNGNGVGGMDDALLLMRFILGAVSESELLLENGDMDSSGVCDMMDALMIMRNVLEG